MVSSVFKNDKYFSWLYFSVGLLDLLFISINSDLRVISKPLIMLSMILFFYSNARNWNKIDILFFLGLLAALFGDIFLLFSGEKWFMAGLGSFMLMQILYSISFFRNSFAPTVRKVLIGAVLVAILYFFLGQFDALGAMRIPVTVYSSCITLMAFLAISRATELKRYFWVVIGAILFMISDGIIGWTQFNSPIYLGGLAIMTTYILAQYFIVLGFMKRDKR